MPHSDKLSDQEEFFLYCFEPLYQQMKGTPLPVVLDMALDQWPRKVNVSIATLNRLRKKRRYNGEG